MNVTDIILRPVVKVRGGGAEGDVPLSHLLAGPLPQCLASPHQACCMCKIMNSTP